MAVTTGGKFRVHFEYDNGTQDDVVIQGDTIEECRKIAEQQLVKRGVENNHHWAEEIK